MLNIAVAAVVVGHYTVDIGVVQVLDSHAAAAQAVPHIEVAHNSAAETDTTARHKHPDMAAGRVH